MSPWSTAHPANTPSNWPVARLMPSGLARACQYPSLKRRPSSRRFGYLAYPAASAAFTKRFAYFAPYTVLVGTYAGQSQAIESVTLWNFVAVHRDAPNDLANWLTRACLENAPTITARYPAARASTLANLSAHTFMPFHPVTLQYFKEQGVNLS
jgi:hypothetical protein